MTDKVGEVIHGYVYISPAGAKTDAALKRWIDLCVRFSGKIP
jgi:hypothetical protein